MKYLLLLSLVFMASCTKQRLTIDSTPTGSSVEINGRYVGKAPVTVVYVETGKFRVRLEKDGFSVIDTRVKVRKQWFNYPLLDFFAEVIPYEWSSRKSVSFIMTKKVSFAPEKLKLKADAILKKDVGR